jgi:hypothetical protein
MQDLSQCFWSEREPLPYSTSAFLIYIVVVTPRLTVAKSTATHWYKRTPFSKTIRSIYPVTKLRQSLLNTRKWNREASCDCNISDGEDAWHGAWFRIARREDRSQARCFYNVHLNLSFPLGHGHIRLKSSPFLIRTCSSLMLSSVFWTPVFKSNRIFIHSCARISTSQRVW